MWTKHNQFIARLKGKSDEQIQELIDSNFEIKDCKGIHSCFNAAVKIMFSTRTTTRHGSAALQTLYPYYVRLFPKLTTRRKYLSQVRQVIKATGNIELWEQSKNDDTFNMNKVERSTVIAAYKKQVIEKNKDKIQIDLKQIKEKIAYLATSNKSRHFFLFF